MQLQTKRLQLRELVLADLEHIHRLHSLPETDRYNTLGIPVDIQTTGKLLDEWMALQKVIPRVSYIFSIALISSGAFVGLIALNLGKLNYRNAEVWYKLHPTCWRMGYASEALQKLLEFGFADLKLHRIEAGCAVENKASMAVLEKAGFIREGRKRRVLPIRGDWVDNYFYAILETEFN